MDKKLFVETIDAVEKQAKLDVAVENHLGKAFPDAFTANLMPRNEILQNALIKILKIEMNDLEDSWIEYFCWELDFGKNNHRLKVISNEKEIPLTNASELYDFLLTLHV